jgi:hypothetical protein
MENIKDVVTNKCLGFLSEALKLAATRFGSTSPPYLQIERTCLTGNRTQKISYRILDIISIWNRIEPLYRRPLQQPFQEAKNNLQCYIGSKGIKPPGLWVHDIEKDLLLPLIGEYLEQAKVFFYYPRIARKIVNAMLRTLESAMVDWIGLMAFEKLHIAGPFPIEKGQLYIRPIEDSDVLLFDRSTGRPLHMAMRFRLPQRDWKICEIRTQGLRGTADGWNSIQETAETLLLALRAFKSGSFKAELISIDIASSFEKEPGKFLGGRIHNVNGTKSYEMLDHEIPEFKKFWKKFRYVMTDQQHYLQVPLRRLMFGAERVRPEDELIDYVVGLESLLSTKNETGELRYRFAARGCVVLASKKAERKNYFEDMKDIYKTRSKIVHGEKFSAETVHRHVALAESALRSIWSWYFKQWYRQGDKKKAIDWIDNKLTG